MYSGPFLMKTYKNNLFDITDGKRAMIGIETWQWTG